MGTLLVKVYKNGVLTNPTSVEAEDAEDAFGVRSTDDYTVNVASGTALSNVSTGVYTLSYTTPYTSVTAEFAIKVVYSGETYYYQAEDAGSEILITVILPDTSSYYSSQAEVLRLLGSFAEDLIMEDSSSRQNVWTDVLEDADETIKMYILQHYDPTLLLTNKWVRRRATLLVANLLSGRRGNPPIFSSRMDRVYEELNMIRDGRMRIPSGTVRSFHGPIVRNYMIQNRFWIHPVRVETSKSTKAGNYGGEDVAIEPYIYHAII